MFALVSSLLAAIVALIALPFTANPLPGDRVETITVAGIHRTYVLHVPASLSGATPVILAFHGHFGTGADFSRLTGLDALADRYGLLVVYPDGLDRGWDDGRSRDAGHHDVQLVDAIIGALARRYPLDRRRVYATGFSNGAMFAQLLACERSSVIAAIAPAAGPLTAAGAARCRPQRPVSVLEMGGTGDPLVPFAGGQIRLAGIPRGEVWSASRTVSFWAKTARCGRPVTWARAPVGRADGTSVSGTTYASCERGSTIELVRIAGGGHTWPGGAQFLPRAIIGIASTQFDASTEVVSFFLDHPMR